MVDYKSRIIELLNNNMTEKSFKLWEAINKRLPDIWNNPTSSTGKYHKKLNGYVPTIAEHTYEMLYSLTKLLKMFDYKPKTTNSDSLLLAAALHDALKYGPLGTRKHTDNKHDKHAADMVAFNEQTFRKILSEDQFNILETSIRFHSGRWSTDVRDRSSFDWKDYNHKVFLLHILDMLSTADCLVTDIRE